MPNANTGATIVNFQAEKDRAWLSRSASPSVRAFLKSLPPDVLATLVEFAEVVRSAA